MDRALGKESLDHLRAHQYPVPCDHHMHPLVRQPPGDGSDSFVCYFFESGNLATDYCLVLGGLGEVGGAEFESLQILDAVEFGLAVLGGPSVLGGCRAGDGGAGQIRVFCGIAAVLGALPFAGVGAWRASFAGDGGPNA